MVVIVATIIIIQSHHIIHTASSFGHGVMGRTKRPGRSPSSQLPLVQNRRGEPNALSQLYSDANNLGSSNQINGVPFS